jgi:hypothetical protein
MPNFAFEADAVRQRTVSCWVLPLFHGRMKKHRYSTEFKVTAVKMASAPDIEVQAVLQALGFEEHGTSTINRFYYMAHGRNNCCSVCLEIKLQRHGEISCLFSKLTASMWRFTCPAISGYGSTSGSTPVPELT